MVVNDDYIKITLNDLIDILSEYDLDRYEHDPLDVKEFSNYIYNMYFEEQERNEGVTNEKWVCKCFSNG